MPRHAPRRSNAKRGEARQASEAKKQCPSLPLTKELERAICGESQVAPLDVAVHDLGPLLFSRRFGSVRFGSGPHERNGPVPAVAGYGAEVAREVQSKKRCPRGVCGRGGVLIIRHGHSRMTIDARTPTMPGKSTSGFHRPGRHR